MRACSSNNLRRSGISLCANILSNAFNRKKLFRLHAGPKTQPGGAQGACFNSLEYSFRSLFLPMPDKLPSSDTATDNNATCHHLSFGVCFVFTTEVCMSKVLLISVKTIPAYLQGVKVMKKAPIGAFFITLTPWRYAGIVFTLISKTLLMQTSVVKTKHTPKLKWWQVALLSVAVSLLGSLSGIGKKRERKLYSKELKQAPWAPPGWVFGPAWSLNNFFLLKALDKILAHKEMPERRKLLLLQALIWTVYFSFNYVYFRKKSPVLAGIWSMSDAVFAAASLLLARRSDARLAANFVPLFVWTGFASTLAGYQALHNPDPLLNTPPASDYFLEQ